MMLVCSAILSALAALAAAQSAEPVNHTNNTDVVPDKLTTKTPGLGVITSAESSRWHWVPIAPLTKATKALTGSKIHHSGPAIFLRENNPNSTKNLNSTDYALTSCDPQAYTELITLEEVVQNTINQNVAAIIFYTLTGRYCQIPDLKPYGHYTSLYTLYAFPGKLPPEAVSNLPQTSGPVQAGIWTRLRFKAFHERVAAQAQGGGGSTAVAMIILYGITGVITALFLVIIVSGAIRAHRHPERYGPRASLGRPRQSRAKGIARAMLDTIPIVKFGENNEQPNKDVESTELESRASPSPAAPQADNNQSSKFTQIDMAAPTATDDSVNVAADPIAAGTSRSDSAAPHDDDPHGGLGCSICTDDFEIGQDIRLLPCNHKFHPACVDPWLLEVSGTCPLCRVDLHPQSQTEPTDDLPPPLGVPLDSDTPAGNSRRRNTLRTFVSSRLNRRGLQGTSAEERIEVLRRWREANAANRSQSYASTSPSGPTNDATSPGGDQEEQSSRNRRLNAFSRLIRRRER